jgi:hypothetical protein
MEFQGRCRLRTALKRSPSMFNFRSLVPHALTLVAMAASPVLARDLALPPHDQAPPRCGEEPMWEATIAKPPRRVCAADFGIFPLDGLATTDQGPALRAALAQLEQQGAVLFLPSGRYAFAGELLVPGGSGLIGSPTGNTRLRSAGPVPARITTDASASSGVLIEGLQLYNTRIEVNGKYPATVRWNGLVGTVGREAQIVARGPHTVDGNVLWRSQDEPGFGIDLRTAGDTASDTAGAPADAEAPQVSITRNLIGAIDADQNPVRSAPDIAPPTRAMLKAMSASPSDNAEGQGHYLVAIRSMSQAPIEMAYNRIAVSAAGPASAHSPRAVAQILSPRDLTLWKNSFEGIGFKANEDPPVVIDMPSNTSIDENRFTRVPLILTRSGLTSGPIKKTRIWDNRLNRASMEIRVAVNGMAAQQTSPDDVEIRANRFWVPPRCALTMRQPEAGTRNFTTIANHDDFSNEEVVPCLR